MMSDNSGRIIGDLLHSATQRLAAAGIDTPDLDARLLMLAATGFNSVDLISRNREFLLDAAADKFNHFIDRRLQQEPVHRIVGSREFYGRPLSLGSETLVPRPDTEVLVDHVLKIARDEGNVFRILDIGTGSGAIAITLAAELHGTSVLATDISSEALEIAVANATNLGMGEQIEFVHGDLFKPVSGLFDVIVSNPPYIRSDEIASLQAEVRLHDPILALDGGSDGLDFYRRLFGEADSYLNKNGLICVEIGYDQSADVCAIADELGYADLRVVKDLSGNDRVISGVWPR